MSDPQRTVVLFVHGPPNVGGDSVVLLRTIRSLDRQRFAAVAVAPPDTEAWRRLEELAKDGLARIFPLQLGVVSHLERDLPEYAKQRRGRGAQVRLLAGSIARLLRLVVTERVDIIYTMDRSRAVVAAAVAARALRRGLVWHGHCPWTSWEFAVRAADRAVLISKFVRREYERHGVPRSRISVIHNGIDTTYFGAAGHATDARRRIGLAKGGPLVLMPGRLSRFKGQLELVNAIPQIRQRVPEAQFVFAGDDSSELGDLEGSLPAGGHSMLAILRQRIAELGLDECTHFLRPSDQEMADLFAAADVVTVPSWSEPFGLVVVEAMASGTAVVASAAGGIPEIVVEGETGFLVPPGEPEPLAESVVRLLEDDTLRSRMGAAAQARARDHFSIEHYIQQISTVFSDVAASRTSRNTHRPRPAPLTAG